MLGVTPEVTRSSTDPTVSSAMPRGCLFTHSEAEQGLRTRVWSQAACVPAPALPLVALASHVISAGLCARYVRGPACTWVPSPGQASQDGGLMKDPKLGPPS